MASMLFNANSACRRSPMASSAIVASALLVACAVFAPATAPAQSSAQATSRILMEHVSPPGDSTHSSAVLYPSEYSASRRWPVLFVLDPRGRAMPSLERFAGAALEWMHSRAMLGGRIAVDSAFVLGRIRAELYSARALERSGQLAKAAA